MMKDQKQYEQKVKGGFVFVYYYFLTRHFINFRGFMVIYFTFYFGWFPYKGVGVDFKLGDSRTEIYLFLISASIICFVLIFFSRDIES